MPAAHLSVPTNLLFVYGTLMQAFDNPYARQLRQQSRFVGQGQLPGVLYRVSWYPGAIPDPTAATVIYGEVYELTDPEQTLTILDDYEDVTAETGLYIRQEILVQVGHQTLTCWMYSYNASTTNLVPVEGGRWGKG